MRMMAITSYSTVSAHVLPLIVAALLLDVCIVAIWYFIGVVLNNSAMKESAKGEYYQFLGTVVIIGLILWAIITISSLFYSAMSSTALMSPSAISTMCTSLESGSQFNLVGGDNSILSGAQTASGNQLYGLCSLVNSPSGVTGQADYPLAATAIVIANITNQTVTNLNSAYVFDSYIGFLSSISPTVNICFAPEEEGAPCFVSSLATISPSGSDSAGASSGVLPPPSPAQASSFFQKALQLYIKLNIKFTPYAGFGFIYSSLGSLGTLLTLSTESSIAQLLLTSLMLYIWPYLLFGGILFRSTFITRKLGGLLIAVALGAILIFPFIFSIEYLTLSNNPITIPVVGSLFSASSVYGFNAITTIPAASGSGNYQANFFVEPSLWKIAGSNGCWPGTVGDTQGTSATDSHLLSDEMADVLYLNAAGGVASGVVSLVETAISSSAASSYYLPFFCPKDGALNALQEMEQAYGVIGVITYFIPLMNLIITITAIVGMSGLMGGDTSLEGLSKFV